MELFKGYCPAIITPFKNNKINFKKFAELIEMQIENGAKAIVFLGTTGEPATMTSSEKISVVKFAVKQVGKRVPVIVGAGSNNTKDVIKNIKAFDKLQVDGYLIVTPYYNKCTQTGLIEHYSKIAKSTTTPIILYNVPSRTGVNMLPETIKKLTKFKNIIGVKEASGNAEQIMELFRLCKDDLTIYSGDDSLTYLFLSLGGGGVISVLGNLLPALMNEICESFYMGYIDKSLKLSMLSLPLMKSMFYEVNPIPIKTAMNMSGFDVGLLRLPLTKMSKENAKKLNNVLKDYDII